MNPEEVDANDEHIASPEELHREDEGINDETANVDSSDDTEESQSTNPTEKVGSLDEDNASSSRNCNEDLSSDVDPKEVNQSFEEAMSEDLSSEELLNCDSLENSTASDRLLNMEVANVGLLVSDVLGEAESASGRTESPVVEENETENECREDGAQPYTDDTDCQIVPLEEDSVSQLDGFPQGEPTFEDSELFTDAHNPCVSEDLSNIQLLESEVVEEGPDCDIAYGDAVLTDTVLDECTSEENPEPLLESDSVPEVYIVNDEDCIDDKLSSIMEENEGLDEEQYIESSDICAFEDKEELNEELIESSNTPRTEEPDSLEEDAESLSVLKTEEQNDPFEEATALTCVPADDEQSELHEEHTESLCISTAEQEPTETSDVFEERNGDGEKVDFGESSSVREEKDDLDEKESTDSCVPTHEENRELDEEKETAEISEIYNEGAEESGVDITNSEVEPQSGNESGPLLLEEAERIDKIDDLPCVYFVSDDSGSVDETNGEAECDRAFTVDRRNTITRTRSLTGKVPETVPEETGPESEAPPSSQEPDGTVAEEHSGVKMDGELCENIRTIPVKPKRCLFYPRSYSVESRDLSISVCRETDGSSMEDSRMKRKDENLFQPCVVVSSSSLSKRIHVPLFGVSNPSSVVDIPPPFELASITKKPITKSSPSLLIENESPDKYLKQSSKKKSSFKRFLPIKLSLKKKIESKIGVEVNMCRTASEIGHHGSARVLDFDRRSLGNSPQLKSRSGKMRASDSASTFLFYKDGKKKGMPKTFSRTVSRVESFEDRSRHSYMSLPLTKPRSISFPNADTSDYENIPAMSSDYENIQIPPRRCARAGTFTEFFEDPSRAFSSACENDGYVDMSSFAPFDTRQFVDQESESAYTEPFRAGAVNSLHAEDITSDEDPANSSGEEDGLETCKGEFGRDKQNDAQRRAYRIAKEMAASEKGYVDILQLLHVDFREMVARASGEDGTPVVDEENLTQILCEMPELCQFHQEMLKELEERVAQWEEEDRKIADIILSKEPGLNLYRRFITKFERNMSLLDECCQASSRFSAVVREFELNPKSKNLKLKHYLLKVVQRVPQYCLYLTDYLNNLSPDSTEYEDTQAALVIVGGVADHVNVSVKQGGNFQKLLHIQHSVTGQHEIVQPGRVFIKEGTLMKVSGKVHRPRCCFLMNDVLLYTTPHNGRYKLNRTLSLAGMKVKRTWLSDHSPKLQSNHTSLVKLAIKSRGDCSIGVGDCQQTPLEELQHPLRIQSTQRSLTFSVSSSKERDEWFDAISKALEDYRKVWGVLNSRTTTELSRTDHHFQVISERPETGLGVKPPTLIPDSRVVMCMICTCDFSLTWRRHHCNACGKVVCRTCSRNKYPLKYLKGRPSRVCDQCYKEFKTKELTTNNENSLPVFARSPGSALSSVFHSIQPSSIRKQKRISAALMEVAAAAEGSSMNGYLQRCKSHKRHWKKLWFVIKDKVLYTYAASGDKVASESLPLLGFTIQRPDKGEGQTETGSVFQLYHKKTLFYSFKAEDTNSAQRWIEAMLEASIL
ncbi:FYVE, RhoGEF and PH domain-containing protein 5 [Callorhinchus milii]|uniref:FYVE, RhoGEF and PH domain-containing protein 5 n=1 Tax=Callorhinchus milii TaxID=7868 RepID=UPI001C3F5D34|nr:FYVE, RhoGEF and PH domain-containing protein 5 [Callorhinchus milii]